MALEYASLLICDAHSVRCTCGKYWKAICGKKGSLFKRLISQGNKMQKARKSDEGRLGLVRKKCLV